MFPESYIQNITERVRLYRELDGIETEEVLKGFEQQLLDRFGPVPGQTIELMHIVRMRWMAKQLGFEKIFLKNGKMLIYFVSNQQSPYYQTPVFEKIIRFVQKHPRFFQMKESKLKLTMSAEAVNSVNEAITLLAKIVQFE